MASTISNTGITNGGRITADQITQVTNALTGTEAYNITISGSLNINNAPITNLTASGNISSSGTIISSNLSGTNTANTVIPSTLKWLNYHFLGTDVPEMSLHVWIIS